MLDLIETAKVNGLEPYDYLRDVRTDIAAADIVEKLEALLPGMPIGSTPRQAGPDKLGNELICQLAPLFVYSFSTGNVDRRPTGKRHPVRISVKPRA